MLVQEAAKGPLRWSSSQAATNKKKDGKEKSIQSLNQNKIHFNFETLLAQRWKCGQWSRCSQDWLKFRWSEVRLFFGSPTNLL